MKTHPALVLATARPDHGAHIAGRDPVQACAGRLAPVDQFICQMHFTPASRQHHRLITRDVAKQGDTGIRRACRLVASQGGVGGGLVQVAHDFLMSSVTRSADAGTAKQENIALKRVAFIRIHLFSRTRLQEQSLPRFEK